MSVCWDCAYKQNCSRLYEHGEQSECCYFRSKFESHMTYLMAEAKSNGFCAEYLFYKGTNRKETR